MFTNAPENYQICLTFGLALFRIIELVISLPDPILGEQGGIRVPVYTETLVSCFQCADIRIGLCCFSCQNRERCPPKWMVIWSMNSHRLALTVHQLLRGVEQHYLFEKGHINTMFLQLNVSYVSDTGLKKFISLLPPVWRSNMLLRLIQCFLHTKNISVHCKEARLPYMKLFVPWHTCFC